MVQIVFCDLIFMEVYERDSLELKIRTKFGCFMYFCLLSCEMKIRVVDVNISFM